MGLKLWVLCDYIMFTQRYAFPKPLFYELNLLLSFLAPFSPEKHL